MFKKAFWAENGNIKHKGGKVKKSSQQPSQKMLIFTTEQGQSFFFQEKRK